MTAKEVLKRVRALEIKAKKTKEKIDFWKSQCFDPVSGSVEQKFNPTRSIEAKHTICIEKIDELERRHEQELMDAAVYRQDIITKIMMIDDPDLCKVLVYRYFEDESWDVIAQQMHYSVRNCHKLHSTALRQFESVINSSY